MARKRGKKTNWAAIGTRWGLLVGRVLIGLLFAVGGFWKLMDVKGGMESMKELGVPGASEWLVYLVGAIAVLGGLAIIVGWCARTAAIVLVVLLLPWTWFASIAPAGAAVLKPVAMTKALVKLAMIGALLMEAVAGPGKISIKK